MNFKNTLLLTITCSILFSSDFIFSMRGRRNPMTDPVPEKLFEYKVGNSEFSFGMKDKSEAFYGRSVQLFSPSTLDQVFYFQTTWDLRSKVNICQIVKSSIEVRNKYRWGNPNSIAQTTEMAIKAGDAVLGSHKHFLGRQIFWMREGWLEILLNDAFRFDFCLDQYLKFGVFPFELGRGISLGFAYATSPGLLGFYSSNIVDQYAPGILLHGDLVKDKLDYDFYYALLENKADSFDAVNEKIYTNRIGRSSTPARGWEKINYLIAARLKWYIENPVRGCSGNLIAEPYVLFNRNPEQRVDFPSDAKSNLLTAGIDVEYEGPKWGFGFEYAANFGHQTVLAWDRNQIVLQRDKESGNAAYYYDHVLYDPNENPDDEDIDPSLLPRAKVSDGNGNKKIVDNSPQDPELNGAFIGTNKDGKNLYNAINRFRAQYENRYKGFMFTTDFSYKITDNFKFSGEFGLATGDLDPNTDWEDPNDSDMDGEYKGFIGLQEIYSGKRVQSLFVIGPNRIPRPLSFPEYDVVLEDTFASNVSGFTNIVLGGVAVDWKFCRCCKEFSITSAAISYWQEYPTKKFDRKLKKTINELADKHLGIEFNTWFEVKLLKTLKAFVIFGFFFPGAHYNDVRGKPINKEQLDALDIINSSVNPLKDKEIPTLGTHNAFILNLGFTYIF